MVEWAFQETILIIVALFVAAIALTLIFYMQVPLPDFFSTFLTSTSATIRGKVYGSPVVHKMVYQGWVPESLPLWSKIRGAWRINYENAEKQNVTILYRCWWNDSGSECLPGYEDYKNEDFCNQFTVDEDCKRANITNISPWKMLQIAVARESATCWGMYGGKGDPLFPGGYGKNPKICSILLYDLTNNFTEDGEPFPAVDPDNVLPGLYEGRHLNDDGIVEYYNVEDLVHWVTLQEVSGRKFPELVPEITSMGYGNWICGSRRRIEKVEEEKFCSKYTKSNPPCDPCDWDVTTEKCEPNINPNEDISDERITEWNYFCNASEIIDTDDVSDKQTDCDNKINSTCMRDINDKCIPIEEIKRGEVQCPLDCTIPFVGGYCSDDYKHSAYFAGGGPEGNCIYTQFQGLGGSLRPPVVNRNELCGCTVESNKKLGGDIAVAAPLTKGRIFITFLDLWNNEDPVFDARTIKIGNSVCGALDIKSFNTALIKTDKVLLCIQDDSWINDEVPPKWGRDVVSGDGKYGLIVTNTGGETTGGLGCLMQCDGWQRGHIVPKWFDCTMLTIEESVVQFFTGAGNKWVQTFEEKPYCILLGVLGCLFL